MTDQERLEGIRDKVSLLKNSSELQPHEFLVDVLHLDWLIQQAERVNKLEETLSLQIKLSEKALWKQEEVIQRYKQALEHYSQYDFVGNGARKALSGESDG